MVDFGLDASFEVVPGGTGRLGLTVKISPDILIRGAINRGAIYRAPY